MPAAGTAAPRSFALLGDPVAHSRSPRIHNAAFAAAGVNATYQALRVSAAEVGARLRELARSGGGGNVTVPHKRTAVAALDSPSELVRRTGAVNTFWLGPAGVHGDNTDVAGFREALRHFRIDLQEQPVLLLGAGGAAAAVLIVLLDAGAQVTLLNRSPERARELLSRLAPHERVRLAPHAPADRFAAVINATSLGLRSGDPHPLPVSGIPAGAAVLDLVYNPGGTGWVRAARAAGLRAFDGSEMLLRQAAASFSLWTGLAAPLDAMRAALDAG